MEEDEEDEEEGGGGCRIIWDDANLIQKVEWHHGGNDVSIGQTIFDASQALQPS